MILNYSILFIAIVLTVAAQLLIKQGVLPLGEIDFSLRNLAGLISEILKSFYIMSGLFLFGITFVLWVWLLSKMQLNVIYPITVSVQLVLLAGTSWILFKEPLSYIQILGIVIIIFGIFLLLYKS